MGIVRIQTAPERTQALLRFLRRAGRLTASEASRLERIAIAKNQPVEETLERERVIAQRDLAILLGETLGLPLAERLRGGDADAGGQLSKTATRVAIDMLIEDALARLADGTTASEPYATAPDGRTPAPPPTDESPGNGRPSPTVGPAQRSFRALVVDDEPDLRLIVRTVIERSALGLAVITAQDADEALALVEIERPDVVILDLSMPGIDGYEVCRRLRQASQTKVVPVLILTANSTPESMQQARDAGADDYVVKPFGREDLIARIRRLIERAYGEDATANARGGAVAHATVPH